MAESERSSNSKMTGERSSSIEKKGHVVERSSTCTEDSQSTNKKGKQPAKKSQESTKGKSIVESESKLLLAINSLQSTIAKQTTKMVEHEKRFEEQNRQIKELSNKFSYYEGYEDFDECEGYENPNLELDYYDDYEQYEGSEIPIEKENETVSSQNKRKIESDENNNSRFLSMSKRFKATEACSDDIDPVLAENITELFRTGVDEDRYQELIKDENNGRPANCEGLVVTATNPLIWEAISATAKSIDKKMQNIERSVVKSATLLAKVVDKMAKMETEIGNDKFSQLIDECNDSLALMGQANKQINLARKDNMRPEIKKEYNHLCNHNRPYTKFLFGDDLSKSAREIEDCSKMSNRMFPSQSFRGFSRRRNNRFPRFRGQFGARGRGYFPGGASFDSGASSSGMTAKNFPRRGGRPYR